MNSLAVEPLWLTPELLAAGMGTALPGLRVVRPDAFAAALAAPQNAYAYGAPTTLTALAAVYAHRVAKAHALLDGNKRTAMAAALAFLKLNGYTCVFVGEQADDAIVGLAAGQLTEEAFGLFLQQHARPTGAAGAG